MSVTQEEIHKAIQQIDHLIEIGQWMQENFSKYQTYADVYKHDWAQPFVKDLHAASGNAYRLTCMWGFKLVPGESDDAFWHSHPVDLSGIFFLSNPEKLGTIFRDSTLDPTEGKWHFFNGRLEHLTPQPIEHVRYSLVVDLVAR